MNELRLNARWLISMAGGQAQLEENKAVLINHGRISAVVDITDSTAAAQTIDLHDQVLLPGYVNAHGHAAMSLLRGYADDLALMTWLNEHIWPAEGQWVGPEFVYSGTELAIAEMLKSGTSCFADMYFFAEHGARACLEAGIRSVNFTSVLEFPTNYAQNSQAYLQHAVSLAERFKNEPLFTLGIGPHAPYTVSNDSFKQVSAIAQEYQLPIQVHLHETAFEVEESLKQYGQRPIARLAELGFLTPKVSCVHMTAINSEDIKLIQQSGAHIVHCPESNLKLASGFAPVQDFLNAGINVAFGTDGAASNNDLNLQAEMKTAAMLAKAVAQDASALPAAQALYMATMGGAKALGLADSIGSIEVGKWADLQAVSLAELEQQPLFNPISQLVYTDSSRHCTHLWVAGKQLLDKGQLCTLDEEKIRYNAAQWARKIHS